MHYRLTGVSKLAPQGWPVVGRPQSHGGTSAGSLSAQKPPQTPERQHPRTGCPTLCCHEGWWSGERKAIIVFEHFFGVRLASLCLSPPRETISLCSEPSITSHKRVWTPGTLRSPGENMALVAAYLLSMCSSWSFMSTNEVPAIPAVCINSCWNFSIFCPSKAQTSFKQVQ